VHAGDHLSEVIAREALARHPPLLCPLLARTDDRAVALKRSKLIVSHALHRLTIVHAEHVIGQFRVCDVISRLIKIVANHAAQAIANVVSPSRDKGEMLTHHSYSLEEIEGRNLAFR